MSGYTSQFKMDLTIHNSVSHIIDFVKKFFQLNFRNQ